MDWSAILVALCSLIGTCLGTIGGMKLVKYQIEELKKQVEQLNKDTIDIPVMKEQIKELFREVKEIKNELYSK